MEEIAIEKKANPTFKIRKKKLKNPFNHLFFLITDPLISTGILKEYEMGANLERSCWLCRKECLYHCFSLAGDEMSAGRNSLNRLRGL